MLQSKKTAQYINMTASSSAVSQSKAEIYGHLLHLSTSADCISFDYKNPNRLIFGIQSIILQCGSSKYVIAHPGWIEKLQ